MEGEIMTTHLEPFPLPPNLCLLPDLSPLNIPYNLFAGPRLVTKTRRTVDGRPVRQSVGWMDMHVPIKTVAVMGCPVSTPIPR